MSSTDCCEALSRTAHLLRVDVFDSDPVRDPDIVAGLRATTVRIIANRSAASSPAGQTAITALYGQLAMTGIQIDLDIPDLRLVAPQPPLRRDSLVGGLLDYSGDLIPGGSSSCSERPELTFVVGDSRAAGAHVRMSWTGTGAVVVPAAHAVPPPSFTELPFGPIAAAAVGAAEGVRAAVQVIADHLGHRLPIHSSWANPGTRRVIVDLGSLLRGFDPAMGNIDAVSGGAITHACLYTLLRVPHLAGRLRVIENDHLDLSNLNRYALARRSLVGIDKVDVLRPFSTSRFKVVGEYRRLEPSSVSELQPFAPKLLVGVDHIPSRWGAQNQGLDRWLCVAATSHDFVLVTEHAPGSPCAGCAHPKDDGIQGLIPTIGFVSLWAGLLQAARALAHGSWQGRGFELWPLGLHNPRGLRSYELATSRQCPVGCAASRDSRRKAG